jgi:hypothetical protein
MVAGGTPGPGGAADGDGATVRPGAVRAGSSDGDEAGASSKEACGVHALDQAARWAIAEASSCQRDSVRANGLGRGTTFGDVAGASPGTAEDDPRGSWGGTGTDALTVSLCDEEGADTVAFAVAGGATGLSTSCKSPAGASDACVGNRAG